MKVFRKRKYGRSIVFCKYRCVCGKVASTFKDSILNKRYKTKSCGCQGKVTVRKVCGTHLMTHSPEYKIWDSMIQRCSNSNNKQYNDYGRRGIRVCYRWKKFENFFADMQKRPSTVHTLERKNNNKGYCLKNCVWATPCQQANNRRSNRFIYFLKERLTVAQFARKYAIPYGTVQYRLNSGWSVGRIVNQPLRSANKTKARLNLY